MEESDWLRTTVFRVRGLPNFIQTPDHVASLLSTVLGDLSRDQIHVYSLATALDCDRNGDYPPSKVATVMLSRSPARLDHGLGKTQWFFRPSRPGHLQDIILDTHFMGMTPLNDVDPVWHSADCIAIPGLASHPFASWQPNNDERYMWLRDELPKKLRSVRSILYGYDTKLANSRSFQDISDLARMLMSELQMHGWGSLSAKPLAFVAHGLGGLLLKQTLVNLAKSSLEDLQILLSRIKGVIFCGVPNLGMDQAHFRAVLHKIPNSDLVDDLARGSNYLTRLDESFSGSILESQLKCFWAYETVKSPTLTTKRDGSIDRNGPPTILVTPASATCRFNETNPDVTIPIDMDHFNMVKFRRGCRYCAVIISKIASICPAPRSNGSLREHNPALLRAPSWPKKPKALTTAALGTEVASSLQADLRDFKRRTRLTEDEEAEIRDATYNELQDFVRCLQEQLERESDLVCLKRLEGFLLFVKEYSDVVQSLGVFPDDQKAAAYLCGPVIYIINIVKESPEAFHCVLDAYEEIGEQIPLDLPREVFLSKPHTRELLVLMYRDILEFHIDVIRQLKQHPWTQPFEASWRESKQKRDLRMRDNLAQLKTLIQSPATSLTQLEEFLQLRKGS